MTQEEARDMINGLIVATQKARSNLVEALCGDREPTKTDLEILYMTQPNLMGAPGKVSVLDALLKLSEIERKIEPGEMYNVVFMCEHMVPAISMIYSMYNHGKQLPEARTILVEMMKDE